MIAMNGVKKLIGVNRAVVGSLFTPIYAFYNLAECQYLGLDRLNQLIWTASLFHSLGKKFFHFSLEVIHLDTGAAGFQVIFQPGELLFGGFTIHYQLNHLQTVGPVTALMFHPRLIGR